MIEATKASQPHVAPETRHAASSAAPALVAEIKNLLAERLDLGVSATDIADDTPLLEGGLALDSIVLVELMSVIEEHFGFTFDDDDLDVELFENPRTLADYITRVTAPSPSETHS